MATEAKGYWYNRTTNRIPQFARAGRRRRFSFVTRDAEGRVVRDWHPATRRVFGAPTAKSLTGQTTP